MNTLQCVRASALGLLALTFVLSTPAAGQFDRGLVPLYTWYSLQRGDYMTTTDPAWRGTIGEIRAGQGNYRLMRIEGLVFDPAAPQPPETVPLYHWWSASRQDNFLTADVAWAGRVGDTRAGEGDYRLFRIEGYVFRRAVAGTLPLYGLWNGTRTDNHTTADPVLGGSIPGSVSTPQGTYLRQRVEGHIVAGSTPTPPAAQDDDMLRRVFGRGRLAPGVATIPVLVMLNEWPDVLFPAGAAAQLRATFSPAAGAGVGLAQYTAFLSGGTFQFTIASVVGPFRETITFAQGMALAGAMSRQDGAAMFRTRAVQLAAANSVDFRRYDRNGDGRVGPSELQIVRYGSDVGVGGQQGRISVALPGITVDTDVLLVASQTPLQGMLHELLHSFRAEHFYGPNFELNGTATVMAGMLGAFDNRTMQLDPWSRLQLGWTRLRVHSLTGPPALQVFTLRNGDASPERAGIILFNPAWPREYFIVQGRDPADPFDRVAPARGIMVWHVQTRHDYTSLMIQRSGDPLGRIAWPRGPDPTQQTEAVLALGADGRLGRPTVFTRASPPIALRWFNGTETGWRIRVVAESPGGATVALEPTTVPVAPRLNQPAAPLARGGTATITGVLPATGPGTWRAYVRRTISKPGSSSSSQQLELPITGWAAYGVTVTVPLTVPGGEWELFVYTGYPGTQSNGVAVVVR